jgi:hypothetical protein
MTPSINRLADSASELGAYILDAEFELVEEQFVGAGPMDFEQFTRWVTGYMYYNAVVCVCGGQIDKITNWLRGAYCELTALAGYDVVTIEEQEESEVLIDNLL